MLSLVPSFITQSYYNKIHYFSVIYNAIFHTSSFSMHMDCVSKLSSIPFIDQIIFNIQKTNIMASGPITSWQIGGETMETVRDFIWGAAKTLQMVTVAMK